MEQAAILDELRHTQIFEEPLSLECLDGGAINRSFRLHSGENLFFIKVFEASHYTKVNRHALFILQSELAKLGLAPSTVYMSRRSNFQVEDWIVHISLRDLFVNNEEKIDCLARTISKIHSISLATDKLNLPRDWASYLKYADVKIDSEQIGEELQRAKNIWLDTQHTDQVFCHNDLAMEHICVGQNPIVFDWEYSAIGNRYFDLASCAVINKLDSHCIDLLINQYALHARISVSEVREKFAKQLPVVSLTNKLWYLAAESIQT